MRSREISTVGTATVASALGNAVARLDAASVDDARLEAEVLLSHALEVDRAHLLARLSEPFHRDKLDRFEALLARRLHHEPLAYITGVRECYGISIACTPAVLIPRPETELLVDLALEEIRAPHGEARVADVGTGSGAVAIAIALNAPTADILATDASVDAIELARSNARSAGISDRIRFRVTDLLGGTGSFDVIVANLPYVSERDWDRLPAEIREHEPRAALVGGEVGTEVIERLLKHARAHVAPRGVLAVEIGDTQAPVLLAAASRIFAGSAVSIMPDLAGLDRVLVVRAV